MWWNKDKDNKYLVRKNTMYLSVVFIQVCMCCFVISMTPICHVLYVCICTPTHYPALKCGFQSKACNPSTLGVTHGLLSLQRVTCFSISSALKNTLTSRCSCSLPVHSSSWAGSVMCQHHANVASVKAVDQIELNGISSRALRSHCARLLNFCCLLTLLSLLL